MLLRDVKQCCGFIKLFNYCGITVIFVIEMAQKQEIWCLKRKSLNINLLFIELLYTINITFVFMLIFGGKNGTLRVKLTI